MIERIVKGWPTTLTGLAALAVTWVFVTGHMSSDQYLGALGVLAGGGLIVSK
ncbi:MAG TPA: hypothetical protein VKV17_16695 [Bryobacteraceae bacterium]|nr:hypothetical protein [Bryobacteraceae bacterium]